MSFTCIKDFNTKRACIRATCIKSASIKNILTYVSRAYIRVWDADIRNKFIEITYIGYTSSINTVKHLKIHLQLFQSLKLG